MIARRSSAVVPAQRAAWARPAAAFPPRRPNATAAGFFFFAMRRILSGWGRVGGTAGRLAGEGESRECAGYALSRSSGLMTWAGVRASCRYCLPSTGVISWEKISKRFPSGSKKYTLLVRTWSAVNSTRAP